MTSDNEATSYHRKSSSQSGVSSLGPDDLDSSAHSTSSSDEEAQAAVADDMLMAERTNQLMSDFRNYINDIQGEDSKQQQQQGEDGGGEGGSNVDAEYGEHEKSGSLMRSWGDSPTTSKPYRDDPFDITRGFGDIHDDIVLSRNRYRSRPTYSKKLKKCLLGTITTAVLVGVIMGIVHNVHRARVERGLPDWEAELAEIQEEEKQKQQQGEPQHTEQNNPQVSEPLLKPDGGGGEKIEPESFYADAQTLDEAELSGNIEPESFNGAQTLDEEATSVVNSDNPNYLAVEEKYSPQWFDRTTDWNGETYDEGLIFCGTKTADGKPMTPCPYSVYCPEAENNTPYGGTKPETLSWAPILDAVNDWVQVGYSRSTCGRYSVSYSNPPEWGKVGGNENTQYILCCKLLDDVAEGGDGSVGGDDMEEGDVDMPNPSPAPVTTPVETPAPIATPKETPSPIATPKETPAPIATPKETPAPQPNPKPTPTEQDFALASDEYNFAEQYSPVWFNRAQGWTGQTWDDANTFCISQDAKLCPYEVYCPTGPNHLPYGGVRPESVVWAPISDSNNGWVSVSGENTCVTYMILNLINPSWGKTGEGNEEMTRHVMCCVEPGGIVDLIEGVAVSDSGVGAAQVADGNMDVDALGTGADGMNDEDAETVSQPTEMSDENREKLYSIVAKEFKPMAFTRDRGWQGQTYTSALMYCASQESKIPCAYEVLCPLGAGGVPISGVREGVYSPIINTPNTWVSLDTCEKLPEPPSWGISETDGVAEDTSVLVCCDEKDDRSNNVPEQNVELNDIEQSILDEYKPIWFGRDHGYLGTSYDDAKEFCSKVAGMDLCPLDVYCPMGNNPSDKTPLFPHHEPFEGEQWAPFLTEDGNSYVLVGPKDNNPTTTCLTHEQLHNKPAVWGQDRVELKENVLCCTSPKSLMGEKNVEELLKPQWLSVSDGWKASSHDDAIEFCESKSLMLCPLSAYCPWGPSHPVISGHPHSFIGEQWAPVYGEENHWVMIGQKYNNVLTTCLTHLELEGGEPDWGLTSDNSIAKQNIMCCSNKES